MNPEPTPYEILGVATNATQEEISAAHARQLELLAKFEASSDTEEWQRQKHRVWSAFHYIGTIHDRMMYDHRTKIGEQYWYDENDTNFDWELYHKERDRYYALKEPAGRDVELKVAVELDTAINGGIVEVTTLLATDCAHCKGAGIVPGRCPSCYGNYFRSSCSRCNGTGKVNYRCGYCKGKKWIHADQKVSIRIPPGVVHKSILTVPGKGKSNQYREKPGNLNVSIRVNGTKDWAVKGANIYGAILVPFPIAILGGSVSFTAPTGKQFVAQIPPGTTAKKTITVEGAGLYDSGNGATGKAMLSPIISVPSGKSILSPDEEAILIGIMESQP